ncbi:MAG: hypothetical protein AB1758_30835, partial [Candidatus Eremiobacterota bacterium]
PEHLERLYRLVWWADDGGHPAIRLELPPGSDASVDARATLTKVSRKGDVLEIGMEETEGRWDALRRMRRLGSVLGKLPSGTRVELCTYDSEDEVGRQRYQGELREGRLHLSHTYPALTAEVLRQALELSRQSEEESHLVAETPGVAEEAARFARKDWADGGNLSVEVEGRRITVREKEDVDRSWLQILGCEVFCRSPLFQRYWPLARVVEEREKHALDWESTLSQISVQLGQAFNQQAGISTGALIFRGARGTYHRSSLAGIKWLNEADLEQADRQMQEAGFEPLGDFNADHLGGACMRAYACPERDAWGCAVAGAQKEFILEFFSQTEQGDSLTTTTYPVADSLPKKKIHKSSHPEATPVELLATHREHLARLGRPRDAAPALEEVAAAVDEFLVRMAR